MLSNMQACVNFCIQKAAFWFSLVRLGCISRQVKSGIQCLYIQDLVHVYVSEVWYSRSVYPWLRYLVSMGLVYKTWYMYAGEVWAQWSSSGLEPDFSRQRDRPLVQQAIKTLSRLRDRATTVCTKSYTAKSELQKAYVCCWTIVHRGITLWHNEITCLFQCQVRAPFKLHSFSWTILGNFKIFVWL